MRYYVRQSAERWKIAFNPQHDLTFLAKNCLSGENIVESLFKAITHTRLDREYGCAYSP
jgi:hypothetical protein